ncbi:MAG: insulinase family protein [Coriobacteriales bacterium]|jgi:Zn-dependent M16 (insulinase) family peptidase
MAHSDSDSTGHDSTARAGRGPRLHVGQSVHGFLVERDEDLPEIDGRAYVLRHEGAGTPLLWLANDDPNKAFAIAFKTPPADDTGVFHILEHSVLCGSDRYPVKEPFVNLLKTSMQTFLNALTYPDKTVYPVASTNEQDLLNLMDVYMDAVLHPALYHKRTVFEQEGWHYELDGRDDRLRYNGVVFNEMKGALSDPEDYALQGLNRALFPDTAYGFESGGNPRAIPTLTYEGYVDTHARHYNAANARIVLYGDISLDRELELLDSRYLAHADPAKGAPNPLRMQAPVVNLGARVTMDTAPENSSVMLGFVTGTYADRRRALAVSVLTDALMGSNEAPLKQRLLDEGLGDDVDAFPYDGVLQPYLVFELRGSDPDDPGVGDRFRVALQRHACDLVRDGIPRETLDAALESLAFTLRERDYGIADGVVLAIGALSGWLYDDGMPTDYLRYEEAMAELREEVGRGGFERLLSQVVLENDHMAQLTLVAQPDGPDSPAAQERAELDRIQASMDDGRIDAVIAETSELHRLQATPDTPEQLATLPALTRDQIGDAPAEPAYGPVDAPVTCLYHEVPTRRIDYVSHYFDLSCVSFDELPAVTLLCSLLGKLGTATHSAAQLDTLLESRLGRLSFSGLTFCRQGSGEPQARLAMSASAIEENLEDLVRLPAEVWSSTDFTDVERIRTILTQQRLEMEQGFAANGHTYALGRALAHVSRTHLLASRFGGVDYYRYVRGLLDDFDGRADALAAQLADLARRIFTPRGIVSSFTGARGDLDAYWEIASREAILGASPDGCVAPLASGPRLVVPQPEARDEAYVIPADVSFVAKAADASGVAGDYSGAWDVAANALSLGYLWDEVRVQGGAYGVGFRVRTDGCMGYYSYRDPNVDATLGRYDRASGWLRGYDPDEREMTGYVVSTVAKCDAPRKPGIVAARQDGDWMRGRTPAWRRQVREQMLACTSADLASLADSLDCVARSGCVCVFGSRAAIEASRADLHAVDLLASREAPRDKA